MCKGKFMTMPDMNKQTTELMILHEVGQLLTTRLTVDGVLDEIYQGTSRLLDATNCYIIFYNAEKHEETFAMRVADGKVEKPYIIQPFTEDGLTGYLITSKQPLLIRERVEERLAELGIHGRQIDPTRPTVSWLGVPIVAADQALGAMAVQSYSTPGLYTETDRDLLMMLAGYAAIAIKNARLFEQMQQEIAERQHAQKDLQQINEKLEERINGLKEELALAYDELQELNKQSKNR
jgi:GAF domain-containing protein